MSPSAAHKGFQIYFTNSFLNRRIWLDHDPRMATAAPDLLILRTCSFWEYMYMKARVYITHPASIQNLKNRIRAEIQTLKRQRGVIRLSVNRRHGKQSTALSCSKWCPSGRWCRTGLNF